MSELTDWLSAQLDADEAAARAAAEESAPEWQHGEECGSRLVQTVREFGNAGYEHRVGITHDQEGLSDSVLPAAGDHIALHDPARVLVEVEAKRAIVAGLVDAEAVVERIGPDLDKPGDQAEWFNYHAWRQAVELLASVFADRPGFDETWRP